ncbi:MAG: flagellar protein FlaG [Ancalomicrobiaceae bacterium]|nr:flagellar protein FlaG [Ancalomicrobiaceae bacterium]
MDVSALYRSFTVSPVQPTYVAAPVADAVDTILPQSSQSVGAAGSSASNGSATEEAKTGQSAAGDTTSEAPPLKARFERDASSNTIVFQEIDSRSEQVILQVPDEQLLKLRNYIAEMKRREEMSRQPRSGTLVA